MEYITHYPSPHSPAKAKVHLHAISGAVLLSMTEEDHSKRYWAGLGVWSIGQRLNAVPVGCVVHRIWKASASRSSVTAGPKSEIARPAWGLAKLAEVM